MKYKLLTPGPLTTSEQVKAVMQFDHCTWDDDYKKITQDIRRQLLELAHVKEDTHTVVLMQGSGTFGVESVLTSVVGDDEKVLLLSNGAYGKRMGDICEHARVPYLMMECAVDQVPSVNEVSAILTTHPEITHIAMVHSETTTGILNDIASIGEFAYQQGKAFIVDAMSSFGGIDIDLKTNHIDFLISSANKCIQGVPGFSFILCDRKKLMDSYGKARSLSLDLYDQWKQMEIDGKWRFTSPTHVVLAFHEALKELQEEGGILVRANRYEHNNKLLIEKFASLGISSYLKEHQGPIITTFYFPEDAQFSFQEMYDYIKQQGYAIYPGKLTDAKTFRIGNIGEIYEEDIMRVYHIMKTFLKERVEG